MYLSCFVTGFVGQSPFRCLFSLESSCVARICSLTFLYCLFLFIYLLTLFLFSRPLSDPVALYKSWELGLALLSVLVALLVVSSLFCKVCHQVHNDGDVFRLRCQHFSRGIDFLCKDCSELVGSSWSWIEICREDQHLNLYWSISSASLQCLYGYFHLHSLFWICSSLLLWSSPRKRWWDHSWYHHYSISQHRHGFFRLGPSTAKSSKWVKSRKTRWEERSMLILLFSSFSNQRLHHSQLFLSVQPSHLLSLPTKPWLVSLIESTTPSGGSLRPLGLSTSLKFNNVTFSYPSRPGVKVLNNFCTYLSIRLISPSSFWLTFP